MNELIPLVIECVKCDLLFDTGVTFAKESHFSTTNAPTTCTHCGTNQYISDCTFQDKVHGYIEFIAAQVSPLGAAKSLLNTIESAHNQGTLEPIKNADFYSSLKPWLPTSIEKLAAWVAIAGVVYTIISEDPNVLNIIEVNHSFMYEYNQTINNVTRP